jgi:hypothetical protein
MDEGIGLVMAGLLTICKKYNESIRVDATTTTWIKYLARLNHILSGSLPYLCFRLTDMVLLILGLYFGRNTCVISGPLSILSILLLVAGGIDLIMILWFLIRISITRNADLSDEELSKRYKLAVISRRFILFIKLIITCVGTGYVFRSSRSSNKQ